MSVQKSNLLIYLSLSVGIVVALVGGYFLGRFTERNQWLKAMQSVSNVIQDTQTTTTVIPSDNEAKIRTKCTEETRTSLGKLDTSKLRGTKDDAVLIINAYYRMCLTKNGMKPEDMI